MSHKSRKRSNAIMRERRKAGLPVAIPPEPIEPPKPARVPTGDAVIDLANELGVSARRLDDGAYVLSSKQVGRMVAFDHLLYFDQAKNFLEKLQRFSRGDFSEKGNQPQATVKPIALSIPAGTVGGGSSLGYIDGVDSLQDMMREAIANDKTEYPPSTLPLQDPANPDPVITKAESIGMRAVRMENGWYHIESSAVHWLDVGPDTIDELLDHWIEEIQKSK